MFCMNPSIGRKLIKHYSICLIVALAADKNTKVMEQGQGKEEVI